MKCPNCGLVGKEGWLYGEILFIWNHPEDYVESSNTYRCRGCKHEWEVPNKTRKGKAGTRGGAE